MKLTEDNRKGKRCFICGVLKREAQPSCWRRDRHYYGRRKRDMGV